MNDMTTARKLMAGTAEQSFEHNDGELLLEDCVLRGNLVALWKSFRSQDILLVLPILIIPEPIF